jgi:hypothetical protein
MQMPNGMRANAPHVVIGLCVMALGVALVLDRLGLIRAEQVLQFWPLGLVLLGASMVLQALRGAPDASKGNAPIGAAIWLVLLGLFLTHTFERRGSAAPDEGGRVKLFSIMGGDRRVIDSAFHGADLTAVMGGVKLDLTNAQVTPGEPVVIDVFALMGGAEVYVPEDWTVDLQAISILGGTEDKRRTAQAAEGRRGRRERDDDRDEPAPPPAPPAAPLPIEPVKPDLERPDSGAPGGARPRVVLRGFVMMGGLVIKSSENQVRVVAPGIGRNLNVRRPAWRNL